MPSIESVLQSSETGARVALFRLDTTVIGGGVLYFCQAAHERDGSGNPIASTPVVFNGITYTPVDIQFEGFETSATGALPTPKMSLSNVDGVWQSVINTYGDLTGCTIQRIRTFERFLDGRPDADPLAFIGPDTFRVERKTAENKIFIEWELSAAIDQEGKKLPGRTVIRDTCLWRYRRYDAALTAFDYSRAQCPYTGSTYYDANDEVVVGAANDVPSRRLSCCKARFGNNVGLPFGGFPGAARVRT